MIVGGTRWAVLHPIAAGLDQAGFDIRAAPGLDQAGPISTEVADCGDVSNPILRRFAAINGVP
jgi:hypothetical protein